MRDYSECRNVFFVALPGRMLSTLCRGFCCNWCRSFSDFSNFTCSYYFTRWQIIQEQFISSVTSCALISHTHLICIHRYITNESMWTWASMSKYALLMLWLTLYGGVLCWWWWKGVLRFFLSPVCSSFRNLTLVLLILLVTLVWLVNKPNRHTHKHIHTHWKRDYVSSQIDLIVYTSLHMNIQKKITLTISIADFHCFGYPFVLVIEWFVLFLLFFLFILPLCIIMRWHDTIDIFSSCIISFFFRFFFILNNFFGNKEWIIFISILYIESIAKNAIQSLKYVNEFNSTKISSSNYWCDMHMETRWDTFWDMAFARILFVFILNTCCQFWIRKMQSSKYWEICYLFCVLADVIHISFVSLFSFVKNLFTFPVITFEWSLKKRLLFHIDV